VNFNNCTFAGRLTSDAELKQSSGGNPYSNFRIAVNNKKDNTVMYLGVVLFGKVAESLSKFLVKGAGVIINGELKIEETEKEGVKRTFVSVIARDIQLNGSTKKEDE
jgi:single-strand DNA-binding protein